MAEPYYKLLGGWMAGVERGNLFSNSAEPLLPASNGLVTSAANITSVSAVIGPTTVGSQAFMLKDAGTLGGGAVEALLLETGDYLLLETGDKLLLESSGGGGSAASLHSAHESITLASSQAYALSFHAKQIDSIPSEVALRYWQAGEKYIGFNVQSGTTLFNTGTGTPYWKEEGGGWFRVGVEWMTGSVGAAQLIGICTVGSGGNLNYSGATGSERGVYFAGGKLEITGVSAYRATTGTPEVSTLSVAQSWAQVPDQDVYAFRCKRRVADILNRMSVGNATISLDHEYGQYISSMKINHGVRLSAITDAGSEYFLFTGRVKSWDTNPALGRREMTVRAVDAAEDLRQKISLPLAIDTVVSSLLTDVLSTSGFPADRINIGALNDSISFGYLSGITAGEAVHRIIQSGAHLAWVDGSGTFRAESRNYDIRGTTAVESMETFFGYNARDNDSKIINDMSVIGQPRREATDIGTVAWIEESIRVGASLSVTFTLNHVDPDTLDEDTPVNSFVTLVASQDYYMSTQESFGGSNLTSAISLSVTHFATTTEVTAYNSSSFTGYLSRFQLRGLPLQLLPKIEARVETSSSQSIYGQKSRVIENDLIPDYLRAQSFAEFMALRYPDPPRDIRISRKNVFPEVVQREILDPIHIVNSLTGVASDFSIYSVEHVVTFRRGLEHTTQLETELGFVKEWLVLGHPEFGLLDQRRLGY